MGQVWQIHPLAELHWRGWGGEWVAFERVSGHMRTCDALEAATLACLEGGPESLDKIHALLAEDLGIEPCDELAARLQTIIADFAQCGWLAPAG